MRSKGQGRKLPLLQNTVASGLHWQERSIGVGFARGASGLQHRAQAAGLWAVPVEEWPVSLLAGI